MPWYYAEGTTQNGPVTDEIFADLVRTGQVRADTLVWQEGMANWQPYSAIAPSAGAASPTAPPLVAPLPGVAAAGPGEVVCHECGKVVSKENAIQYGTVSVCANCKPLFVQKLREGAGVTEALYVRYGGFWIRFLAKLIDSVILNVVGFIIGMVLALPSLPSLSGGSANFQLQAGLQALSLLVGFVIDAAYKTFFIGKFAATPGKMACGLRVIVSDGSNVSYMRALGRALAEYVSAIFCAIGYIIAAFDSQKRTLHDHMCDTRVVRK
ncbi:MAG: RDD family protein [Verrucomicrobia subdivision 3 bacterium]|nr:RDD family protein [Limisphaerales bacterium]